MKRRTTGSKADTAKIALSIFPNNHSCVFPCLQVHTKEKFLDQVHRNLVLEHGAGRPFGSTRQFSLLRLSANEYALNLAVQRSKPNSSRVEIMMSNLLLCQSALGLLYQNLGRICTRTALELCFSPCLSPSAATRLAQRRGP